MLGNTSKTKSKKGRYAAKGGSLCEDFTKCRVYVSDRHGARIIRISACSSIYPLTQAVTRDAPKRPMYCRPVLPMGK